MRCVRAARIQRQIQNLHVASGLCFSLLFLGFVGGCSEQKNASPPGSANQSGETLTPENTMDSAEAFDRELSALNLTEPDPGEAESSTMADAAASSPDLTSLSDAGLTHVTQLSARIISGSAPTEDAFEVLAAAGVKTIVSVDGAPTQVDAANAQGLRYVHIPFGYGGIPESARLSLVRVVRETTGLIYVHCHHGRHRGPAAAAIACLAEGSVDTAGALAILENAGTSRDYAGLWRDVETFVPPSENTELPELTESAEVPSLVTWMAEIDRRFDNLSQMQAAGWNTPADLPDLEPQQVALLLQEGFYESARALPADADPQLKQMMEDTDFLCVNLFRALKDGKTDEAAMAFEQVKASCTQCHSEFRH
ncbi:MAG: hypothetical protein KDA85_20540 [Planctomycetaceae bacterium]|nr:hypothetical protein [Planctomycetaceae bacterium]